MPSIGRMNRRGRGTLGHIVHKERTLVSARDKDRLHHRTHRPLCRRCCASLTSIWTKLSNRMLRDDSRLTTSKCQTCITKKIMQ